MNRAYNYIDVNYPNIPVLTTSGQGSKPLGQFVATPEDERNAFEASVANVKSIDMYLPNFSLRVMKGEFQEDVLFSNQKGEAAELPGSCLFQKGIIKTLLPGNRDCSSVSAGFQNFKYDPQNEFRHWSAAGSPFNFIHFSYTASHFNSILPENEKWADELRKRINMRQRVLGERSMPITLAQEHALQNIFDCPLTGKLGYMMIETSIVQIILIQLHALFSQNQSATSKVAKRDIEIIQALKEHLTRNFLDDHSLDELARNFGTNTNKLMSLFKKFFHKSIFEYIGELRMEHANQMLLEKDARIIDIARVVGYKNPNHFSAAFKKRYGVNPSQLKAA